MVTCVRNILVACAFVLFAFSGYAESYLVKPGDTLAGILSSRLNPENISVLSKQIKQVYPNFVLRTDMKMIFNGDKVVIQAAIDKDLIIETLDNGGVSVELLKFEQNVVKVLVRGEIKTNLFDAVKSVGEDAELAAMLASIFEWEIDFFKDLQPGDKFVVLVEKKFVKDKYAGYGKILAADFYNKGKLNRAIYFEDGKTKGYFNENGRALERGFLRVPLNYARISSRFTDARMHPVFKEVRPHYGVDYAAATGTPVMATASGVVEAAEYAKGNGNYVALRHSNGYKTFYLHLSRFNRAAHRGAYVTQGQVIGYVGSTGFSTGPHLDYRIKRNNTWLNPLKFVATPTSLKKDGVEKLRASAKAVIATLNNAFATYNEARPMIMQYTCWK